MPSEVRFRRWLFSLAGCVLAVVISIYFIDRPVAEFFNVHLRHTKLWTYLDRFLAPFVLLVVAALFFLLGSGCWVLSGRQLRPWTLNPLLCSWSAVWALAAEFIFKEIFGRGWPDPTYIQNGLYGFRFMHGSSHWSSFPSGTATISTAIAATVWLLIPRLRRIGLLLAVILCSEVVVTNGHWLSDVIAGAFLGGSIGFMTVLLHSQSTGKR